MVFLKDIVCILFDLLKRIFALSPAVRRGAVFILYTFDYFKSTTFEYFLFALYYYI